MIDLYDSSVLLHRAVATIPFLPPTHINAFETYVRSLSPTTSSPYAIFHSSLLALQSTIDAILSALTRPPRLINQINASKRTVERSYSSLSRSTRWPLGLLDDTRQRINEEREERMRAGQAEVDNLSRELRYTQQTVAMELAGWQDMHERMGRRAIRELARNMVVVEKMRLEGMRRALRKLKEVQTDGAGVVREGSAREGGENAALLRSLTGLDNVADQKADADLAQHSVPEGSTATISTAERTVQPPGDNDEPETISGQAWGETGAEGQGSASEQAT